MAFNCGSAFISARTCRPSFLTREITEKNAANLSQQWTNDALRAAQSEVEQLQGIIPICMHCKGIRDDLGYWNKLEQFISERSDTLFSRSICHERLEKYYGDAYPAE